MSVSTLIALIAPISPIALIEAATAAVDELPNPADAPHHRVMHPVGERVGTHVGCDPLIHLRIFSLTTGSDHVGYPISSSRSGAARPIIRSVVVEP